jgi:PLP dependent protein
MVLAHGPFVTTRIGIFALDNFHMMITIENYRSLLGRLGVGGRLGEGARLGADVRPGAGVQLVAVSKTKPAADILALYAMGQRDFGENYVQELVDKARQLPTDIRWHFIGHLQTNKVKAVVPFVHLIHAVDSMRVLGEIDKQAALMKKVMDVLLQVHIAREETKFGMDAGEVAEVVEQSEGLKNVRVRGLMGMASNTGDVEVVREEFRGLKVMLDRYFPEGGTLSMGMTADYEIAIEEGSNMVRIGSLLFGDRDRKR